MFKKMLVAILFVTLSSISVITAQSSSTCKTLVDATFEKSLQDSVFTEIIESYKAEEYITAEQLLSTLIEETSDNSDAYLYRSCSHYQLGNLEEAYADLLTYVSLTSIEIGSDTQQKVKAEPVLVGEINLSQTETIEAPEFGGSISVSYPEGWAVKGESGAILLANSEEILAIEDPGSLDEIPKGAVLISLSVIPSEMNSAMGLGENATPKGIVELFSSFMVGEDMPEFGDIEELIIGDSPAARVSGSDDKINAIMYAIDNDGNFTFGFGATRPDEADANADVIQAIIASATFAVSE